MRLWPLVSALAVFAVSGNARAGTDDELPTGNEAPRPVLTGVIDGYYAWHDVPPPVHQSSTLTTASRHDEFSVNLAAIGVRLEHAKLTGAVVLQVGDSVEQVYGNHRLRYVQLANVGWKTGIVHIEAGVMPSNVGRESFVSTDNWAYTRAFIADATPYYVTGARITAHVSPTWLVGATVFNGWKAFHHESTYPHGQVFSSWKPSDAFSLDGTILVGQCQVSDDRVVRTFADLVATLKPHNTVTIALEAWAARENGYSAFIDATTRRTDPVAYGGVLSARWAFTETVWVAGRGEAIADLGGFITGTGDRDDKVPPAGQKLLGGAFTFGWQPHPKLLGRVEVLQRYATEGFFAGSNGELKQQATTFSVSAAVAF